LQNSINKYGIENFIFVIVEYCDSSQLLVLAPQEQYYLDWLFGLLPELRYNFAQDATAPMSGRSHSEESKATISEAMSAAAQGKRIILSTVKDAVMRLKPECLRQN
jgi:group I intron endonuclease